MSRYIDAEPYAGCRIVANREDDGIAVDEIKTVDAVPVVHGHWIEHYAFGCFHYDCSICDDGFAIKNKQKELPNYCANCGAKMDGAQGADDAEKR